MSKQTIHIECRSCNATGLYSGFCEAKGTAVVCVDCGGTGAETFQYTPFTKRKGKRGINTVRLSRGRVIGTGVGAVGKSISYKEFSKGKFPIGEDV